MLKTGSAKSVKFQVPGPNLPDVGNLFRQFRLIKIRPIHILHSPAEITDKVVMRIKIGVEEITVIRQMQFSGYTQLVKCGQSTINRVYGYSRHLLLQSLVHALCRRMASSRYQLFENFQALVGEFNPCLFTNSPDPVKVLIVEFLSVHCSIPLLRFILN